jgi:alkylhydroperoxidase/carboxymuconolactone decarboxylase family protein YurZ
MVLSTRQEEIRQRFETSRGWWGAPWDTVLEIDPDFVSAYLDMYEVPGRKSHLTPKFRELCRISINSAATHLYVPGIEPHIQAALDLGATPAEILEVLEERGRTGPKPLDEYQEGLKARFTEVRGYWHDFCHEMLELDPEFFEAYLEFSSVPWNTGSLSPAEKELIYISYDIAATHLYSPGTKLHIRNALAHGASVEQVLEVMEISSMVGIHSVTTAVPILAAEMRRRGLSVG